MGGFDKAAVVVGVLCAFYVFFACKQKRADERLLFAFGNGSSATYLACLAYGVFWDPAVRDAVLTNSSVLLLGSLAYAAVINMASVHAMSSKTA